MPELKFIEVMREFDHADGVYPVTYQPGIHAVVESDPGPGQVSARCAEVALAEGWAREVEGTVDPDYPDDPVHTGNGWYELPNGEKIHGKPAAFARMEELRGAGTDPGNG